MNLEPFGLLSFSNIVRSWTDHAPYRTVHLAHQSLPMEGARIDFAYIHLVHSAVFVRGPLRSEWPMVSECYLISLVVKGHIQPLHWTRFVGEGELYKSLIMTAQFARRASRFYPPHSN